MSPIQLVQSVVHFGWLGHKTAIFGYSCTFIALQFAVSNCTWLNGQAPFRRFTLMYHHGKTALRIVQHNCVHGSSSTSGVRFVQDNCVQSSSSTSGVRCRSVDWIAPRGARNTSRQKIRFLKGRLTPIDGDDDEGRWDYWDGGRGKGISNAAHIRGETTFPVGWLKGSIGVCIHGEVRPALYHNMRTNTITKDLRVQKKNTKAHMQLNVFWPS